MSLQTSALHQVSRSATDALIAAKLLVPSGYVPVVAGMDDYEDEPLEATWSPELRSFGYHDSTGRWIKVANQEIAACKVDYGLALAKTLLARIPTIVAHELIHYQQKYPLQLKRSLLSMAINEGAADFVGEKLCGATINDHIHAYGDEHEAELWAAFSTEMYDTETGDWLYNGQPANGQPADMGYYIGYRICEAYFEQQDEPRAAIKDILEIHDFEDFLRESGYGQQF